MPGAGESGVYIGLDSVCAISVDVDLCTEFRICSDLVSRVGQGTASIDATAWPPDPPD
jgi:hypothetical protein